MRSFVGRPQNGCQVIPAGDRKHLEDAVELDQFLRDVVDVATIDVDENNCVDHATLLCVSSSIRVALILFYRTRWLASTLVFLSFQVG